MSVIAVILLVITICIVFIPWYNKHRRYIKHLERYPSPPRVFLLGNALDFRQPTAFIRKFGEYARLYGDVVKIYVGPFPTKLLVSNYKLVEQVLSSNKNLNKGKEYQYLSKWLGRGLLICDGDSRWKSHRKLLLPSFHVQVFEEFLHVFETKTQLLVRKLETELDSSSFDIQPYIQLCSLDIICEAALGTSIHAQEDGDSDYVKSISTMCTLFIKRSFNPRLRNNFLYKYSDVYREEERVIKILHRHSSEIVERRKKELQQMELVQDEFGLKKKLTLLDLVLVKRNDVPTLTDIAIREEIDTFMFAGHDTTAAAMGFTIFCLSEYPHIQNKVMDELNAIFVGDVNRSVTLQDINEMRYLEAVIKEALRIYPPVPYYSRMVTEELNFGVLNYTNSTFYDNV
uniref:Cytochrome P450 n=1 Tax=Photinus pyralis TaxID=7054 RepID=A0A1Y1KS36_PHOPY